MFIVAAASLATFAAERPGNDDRLKEGGLLAQMPPVDPALVVSWNQLFNEIGFAEEFSFPKAIRAHAMMHIAIHDALNAVVPHYAQYAYREREPGAHPLAAAAQAARVAVSQYPNQIAALDAELARWLSPLPDTPPKAAESPLAARARPPSWPYARRWLGLPGHVHLLE